MRTLIIVFGGFALLALCLLAARALGGGVVAGAKIFMPLWLIAAAVNLWIGVARAGYSVAEELPIFLLIFALPAAAAAAIWWRNAGT